jgi:nitrogen fixation protein NifU and related proteins
MDSGAPRAPRLYEDLVCEHFLHPRNVGENIDADGVGALGDPQCGDYFKVWIRVEGELLSEVKYKVRGCPAAVATCSMMSELAAGKTVGEAYELDDVDIMHALGGLPEHKQHCSNHAAAALREAMDDFVFRNTSRGMEP